MKRYLFVLLAFLSGGAIGSPNIISGVVVNEKNEPEAGVWVIAQTDQLPTNYRKIVVTNDEGRFVLPQLPEARYQVWVRGYGLIDSERVPAKPGDRLKLEVETADDPRKAAEIYPSNYWLSLMEPPNEQQIKGSPYGSVHDWVSQLKINCVQCHQLGAPITRLPVKEAYRIGLNKAGAMADFAHQLGKDLLPEILSHWGKSIDLGKVPPAPPRPSGVERNFVITQWDYGSGDYTYSHDIISSDKRDPTVNAYGPVYGLDLGNDHLLILDPNKHSWRQIKLPSYANAKPWCEQTYKPLGGGAEVPVGARLLGCPAADGFTVHKGAYTNPVNPHNQMLDDKGRLWMTMQVRREWGEDLPDYCNKDPVMAENYHHRQLGYYDTKTGQVVPIDTCFGTHHLQFDNDDVLWVNGDSVAVGWFDTKKYDPADPSSIEKAMGWSISKVDSDGDGVGDKIVYGFRYSVIPNPVTKDVWLVLPPGGLYEDYGTPGYLMRFDPKTDTHEAYRPPAPGYGPRGVDVDSKGNVYVALQGSGHLAKFDRSRCKQTWGEGDQCPEGWTLWETPGPKIGWDKGSTTADSHYYLWVDQFDTLGLGPDTVIVNGTNSDSLLAFQPDTEKFVTIRIPYPLNTFTRGADGRIDKKEIGWKGRGVWFTNGLDPVFMSERRKIYAGYVQLRPDPLAH